MITSLSIGKAKLLESLKRKKNRYKYKQFVIEGEKLVKTAISLNCPISFIVSTDETPYNDDVLQHIVGEKAMKKLSSLQNPSKAMAVLESRAVELIPAEKLLTDKPIIYLEHIQDPGNLGTIIRTCDWFGYPLVMSPDCVDVLNPKVIQSSMGAMFTATMSSLAIEELVTYAQEKNKTIFAMDMNGASLTSHEGISDAIYVFGNEGQGISETVKTTVKNVLSIPGQKNAGADSLNVAISVAALCGRLL